MSTHSPDLKSVFWRRVGGYHVWYFTSNDSFHADYDLGEGAFGDVECGFALQVYVDEGPGGAGPDVV